MVESLGYVAWEPPRAQFLDLPQYGPSAPQASQATLQKIDEAIRAIVMQAFDTATDILTRNRPVLERCAHELLQRETLDEAALRELTADLQR
jgi:cell division protease FtsH